MEITSTPNSLVRVCANATIPVLSVTEISARLMGASAIAAPLCLTLAIRNTYSLSAAKHYVLDVNKLETIL